MTNKRGVFHEQRLCSLAQLPASLRLFLHGQRALATAPVSLHGAYFSLVSFAAGGGCRAMKRKEKNKCGDVHVPCRSL